MEVGGGCSVPGSELRFGAGAGGTGSRAGDGARKEGNFCSGDIFGPICAKIVHGSTDKCIVEVIYASAVSVFEHPFVSS